MHQLLLNLIMKGTKPLMPLQNILHKHFVSWFGYTFALSQVKMQVLSKGMVSFHRKLKAPWKYINTNKNKCNAFELHENHYILAQ